MEYDLNKNQENIVKHGVSFEDIADFNWETAEVRQDARKDYGEERYIALGYVRDKLHNLVFTYRNDDVRPISFRKCNKREHKIYEKIQKNGL